MKKTLGAILTAILFLSVSFSTDAATYISEAVGGTDQKTGYQNLGNGIKILTVRGDAGNGTAYAKRIVPYLPDYAEVDVSVSAGTTGRGTFKAHKYQGGGAGGTFQSYYVHWKGNSSSKAYVRIID